MVKGIHLADGFTLPLDFVTQTQAILAMRRRGKTYTASVQAEELLKAGQQIVVIDITGAWWGLRSSADGKSGGFDIVVAGGEHGDIPLAPDAGDLIARAIIADRFSCILDLKMMRKGQRLQFLAHFLESFHANNREPVHVFADEADDYCPQQILWKDVNASKCLGAMDDMVRRGGINGIGCTLITQRPAVINNNVLTQCQLLTLLRIQHPADIKPIREWVKVHATPDEEAKVLADLPLLPLGSAFVWSPGWPEEKPIGIRKIQIRERTTFNSSRTPKTGETVAQPKVMARPDLEKLGESIRTLAEKVKADDPANLKKQIADLKADLAKRPTEQVVKEVRVEVPVLKNGQLIRTEKIAERVEVTAGKLGTELSELRRLIAPTVPAESPHRMIPAPVGATPVRRVPVIDPPRPKPTTEQGNEPALGTGAKRRMLTVIAQRPGVTNRQIGIRARCSSTSGTFTKYMGQLRSADFIRDEGDRRFITETGLAALGDYEPLPEGHALLDHWLRALGAGKKSEMLRVLAACYPAHLSNEELAQAAGMSVSGTFTKYLGQLRTLELVEGRGSVRASEELFA